MNASIVDFVKINNFQDEFLKKRVTCFTGNEYPFLFFSLLFKNLKEKSNFDVNFVNVNELDFSDIIAKLDQSFLGCELFYWLSNISEHKKSKELISYLKNYQGPHFIGFFISDEELVKDFKDKFTCGIIASIEQSKDLLFIWDKAKHNIILHFLEIIFKKSSKISLDLFCILTNYSILLGNKQSGFMNQWLDKIIIDEQSFFALSKYFFAYDAKSFFKCWNIMQNNYPTVFWTSFWSEQIYRAINFISLKEQGKNLQAKQIAYKLPFSFIQGDYKNCSLKHLLDLHELIYQVDYAAKNSGNDVMIELFYAKHFANAY